MLPTWVTTLLFALYQAGSESIVWFSQHTLKHLDSSENLKNISDGNNFFGGFFASKRRFTAVCVINSWKNQPIMQHILTHSYGRCLQLKVRYDVNTSFLTPLQLQIQLSFAFQCSSGNLFSKYVKTIAMHLTYTNNHRPIGVAIVSAAARECSMYATWHVPKPPIKDQNMVRICVALITVD